MHMEYLAIQADIRDRRREAERWRLTTVSRPRREPRTVGDGDRRGVFGSASRQKFGEAS